MSAQAAPQSPGVRGESASGGGAALRLEGVTKRFGRVVAVDNVDLEIREGEFFSMLGPSGSGKTTLLRLIAGFELPTSGRVISRSGSPRTSPDRMRFQS